MSEELKRHKEALEVAMQGLRDMGLDFAWHYEAVEAKINAVLHPEPEYEDVEVVRWLCSECGKCYTGEGSPDSGVCCNSRLVKLTGTLRQQKVKVERSVTVEGVYIDELGDPFLKDKNGDADYAFKLNPESHGKTVTLTATWTE